MITINTGKFIRYTGLAWLSALMTLLCWADFWLICTSVLSLIGGLYGLGNLLRMPEIRVNFFLISAVVIVLASAFGVLFGFVSISLVSHDIWEITIDYAHTTTVDLALAQAYANAFAIVFWILGRRLHYSGVIDSVYQNVATCLHDYKRTLLTLVVAILICQLYLFNINVVVYGGKDLATEGEPTHPLLALITPLVSILPFVLAYYTRGYFQAGRWVAGMFFILLLLGELNWFFLFGRRSILYFFILLFAGFGHANVLTGSSIVKNIVPICISLFVILTIADTYHKMRSVYGFQNLQRMNLVDSLTNLKTNTDDEKYDSIRKMNLSVRSAYSSLALGQFVNLFRTTPHQPLAGQILMNSILLATPSDFLIDKKSVLAKEALYESSYSLRLTDISETLYLEAFIDFGWFGGFLYAGFIFLLFYIIYSLASHGNNPLFSLIVSCISVSLALTMIEVDMITFLANIRTLFVYYLVTQLFFWKTEPRQLSYEMTETSKTTLR